MHIFITREDLFSFRISALGGNGTHKLAVWCQSKYTRSCQQFMFIALTASHRVVCVCVCVAIKTACARNTIPSWAVGSRRSRVKLLRAWAQHSVPWIKAAEVVNVLPQSQSLLQFLCWTALLIGPWCSSYFTKQSLNLHEGVLIHASKAERARSWRSRVPLVNIFLVILTAVWFNLRF